LGKFSYSNFIEKELFCIIDFGYARKVGNLIKDKEKKNKEDFKFVHYEDKYENKYEGTPKFMAIRVLEGSLPSRRTDIEELLYTLIFGLKKNCHGIM
jgi:serine/threonine protein kinase